MNANAPKALQAAPKRAELTAGITDSTLRRLVDEFHEVCDHDDLIARAEAWKANIMRTGRAPGIFAADSVRKAFQSWLDAERDDMIRRLHDELLISLSPLQRPSGHTDRNR